MQTKPANVQLRSLRGHWTEGSAFKAVNSWLRLSTSREARVDLVAAQDDSMAIGARKAFEELRDPADREKWLSLPFLGCDGLPKTGQAWVHGGLLTATVVVPANAGLALEMLVQAVRTGTQPPERKLTVPVSFPPIELLVKHRPGVSARAASR